MFGVDISVLIQMILSPNAYITLFFDIDHSNDSGRAHFELTTKVVCETRSRPLSTGRHDGRSGKSNF
jgi:hypothetical protein